MQSDLLAEAVGLYPFRNLQALQTVGYTELFEYIEERISLDRDGFTSTSFHFKSSHDALRIVNFT